MKKRVLCIRFICEALLLRRSQIDSLNERKAQDPSASPEPLISFRSFWEQLVNFHDKPRKEPVAVMEALCYGVSCFLKDSLVVGDVRFTETATNFSSPK